MRLLFFLAVLSGCQTQTTKVEESREREFYQVLDKAQKPLDLGETTVVLDARSAFDFGLNHVQNSQALAWSNFSEDSRKGELLHNLHQASMRLALLGLTAHAPVVIVGYGPQGQGEEGRLGWTLLYYGFRDVQVSSIEALRKAMTQVPSPPAKNVAQETLETHDEMQIEKREFLPLAQSGAKRLERKIILIDVRSPKEFAQTAHPEFAAINIEWKSFYTHLGRPDVAFARRLQKMGITPDYHLVVISNKGVRSAAAAYALLAMGFAHVQNFTAGLESL